MTYRVGQEFLVGKTTLEVNTIIDVVVEGQSFQVVSECGKVKDSFSLTDEDVFAYYDKGISQPETQDHEGRFTIEGNEDERHFSRWEVGQKVEFEAEVGGATLKVQGFIVRNFWSDYYLVSEVGVSVPNRYWKVAHSKCTKCP